MKKLLASVLCVALAISMSPINLVAAGRALQPGQKTGEISGKTAKDGKPLQNYKVQLRNVDTGTLVGTTTSASDGAFKFTGLPEGNYVVETVDAAGNIIATSAKIGLAAGAMIVGNLAVGTSAAAAGAGAAAAGAAAGGAGLATSTIVITAVAVAGGVSAVVAVTNNASSSGG
jgi:hypothetical protein